MRIAAGKISFAALSVLYPGLIFCGLYFWGLRPRILSLVLFAIALVNLRPLLKKSSQGKRQALKSGLLVLIALACCALACITDNILSLKFYPVAVSASLLVLFATTLFSGPSLVFRLACMSDKSLDRSALRQFVEPYCRKVTIVWCSFFIFNGIAATYTCLSGSDKMWAVYNGLISYILMGLLFSGEFIIRKKMQKKMNQYKYVSSFTRDSRDSDSLFAFDGNGDHSIKTWGDFVADVSKVRQEIETRPQKAWLLNFEDSYYFMVALLAVMQAGKAAKISANHSQEFVKEICSDSISFMTDAPTDNATLIQDILAKYEDDGKWVMFDPKKADVDVYTSGTTGKPKVSPKKFIQLEDEVNIFASQFLKKYENAFVIRTVDHHHIFGLTFALLMALMSGAPIRRNIVAFSDEHKELKKRKLVIIASPAFLKRLAGSKYESIDFAEAPFILSAGGALPEDAAAATERILKYWPTEIYGSTETGCMAHRQSKNGPLYTPFPHNIITLTQDGCLHVESPYIYDEGGFTTADLIKLEPDGRFMLLGRTGSIVKIEEKRISLPEVEMRIRQTGLVQDVRVIAMSGKRQYLAAAVALNQDGKEKFKGARKLEMNKFFRNFLSQYLELIVIPKRWRFPDELPQDAMGKIKTADIQALFEDKQEDPNYKIHNVNVQGNTATIEMEVPSTSDFFDGHFDSFKLLPAVVQVNLVMNLAHKHLGSPLTMHKIQRTKFMSPILPDTKVILEISYDKETGRIAFDFRNAEGKKFSNGSVKIGAEA